MVAIAKPKPLLLERDAELAWLSALLEKAQAGSGTVAVISGPPGIGKTALLAAVHRLAGDRGFRSLRARGRELEADMAFSVVRQLLEQPVLSASAGERRRLLAGPARAGASALGLEPRSSPVSDFAAIHGLYWLCVNLAERAPLLLTVDDLQWVDRPSLSWLAYLGPRSEESPMLVVLSVREGDPRGRANLIGSAADHSSVHRVGLSALSAASVAALVRAELGSAASAEFCSRCWELAGGNPLFVRELLAAAHSGGLSGAEDSVPELRALAPSTVGASVLGRLARLGPDAVSLAQALAVLGSQTEVGIAAELAALEPAAAELTADRLAAAQILAPARPLDFFHPLIAESVYADLALGARRLAHRRAAAILDRAGAADRVAAHLLATGPAGDAWVVERLSAAADTAWERGAAEVAASYLRRALAEPAPPAQRPAILLRLGVAEWAAGEPAAIGHLEEALNEAHDSTEIAAAAGPLANALIISDQADTAVTLLERAAARIRLTDPRLALRLDGAAALAGLMDDRTAPAALRAVDRLEASLGETADPPARVLVVIAHAATRRGRSPVEAQQLIERVLAREPSPRPNASASIIVTLLGLEAFGTLQQLCDDMLKAARQRSAVQELMGIASFLAWASYRRGELADAEAQARWAIEHATGIWAIDALAHLVEALVERDELDEAAAELGRMAPPLTSHTVVVAAYLMARGQLRMAQGQGKQALQDFLACGERCERLGIIDGLYNWRSEAAITHAMLGNAAEARRLAQKAVEVARGFGRPRGLGVALRAAGLVEGGERGLDLLDEAVAVLERSEAPVELARALTDHGAALRRAGQRMRARAQLERGLDLAHHLGARRIVNQARSELIAAGAKPRRDAITGRDALTASELRVARLAAAGMTNREIAQTLGHVDDPATGRGDDATRKRGDMTAAIMEGGAPAGRSPQAPDIPDLTLPGFVLGAAYQYGGKRALVDAATGQELSYAELADAVREVAAGLSARGIRPGDVLALCTPNCLEFAVTWFAATSAGASVTTVNPQCTEDEISRQLRQTGARWLVTTAGLIEQKLTAVVGGTAIDETFVIGEGVAGTTPFGSLRVAADPPAGLACASDVALLPTSSGTTGLPKSVELTHRNLVASLRQTSLVHRVTEDDVVIAALPLFHIYGLQITLNLPLAAGATVVILPRFELAAFLRAMQDYGVTRAEVVPPMVLGVVTAHVIDGYDLSALRLITSAAAPLSADLARACARRLGCRVKQAYGMTEVSGGTHIAPDDGPDRPESIGPALPGVECRIVEPGTGTDLGPNEPGELLVRTAGVMVGYLGDPQATAATIDADGWLHTGDIVTVDEDGWFFVTDRVKELIKYKGYQVAPAELEALLLTHPAVADAAVVRKRDALAGEVPKAFVVLRTPASADELMAWVGERVAGYKRVRQIEFTDHIPRSPAGKILRRLLVEQDA